MNEKDFNKRYANKKQFQINKPKKAVALAYTKGEQAPKVVATGKGVMAEKIIEKAQENLVPIHEDERLVDTLSTLDVGEFIPPELYEVVAEILIYVDDMDKIRSKI